MKLKKRFYTAPDLADLIGVHRNTIMRYAREGLLPALKLPGRTGQYIFSAHVYDTLARQLAQAHQHAEAWSELAESMGVPDEADGAEDGDGGSIDLRADLAEALRRDRGRVIERLPNGGCVIHVFADGDEVAR